MDGALASGVRLGKGTSQIERNQGRVQCLGGPLDYGPGHRDLVDILECLAFAERAGAAATAGARVIRAQASAA